MSTLVIVKDETWRRVMNSVAALDRAEPAWRSRIDLDRLEMRSPSDCILGQVFDHYWSNRAISFRDELLERDTAFDADLNTPFDFCELNAAWRRYLTTPVS